MIHKQYRISPGHHEVLVFKKYKHFSIYKAKLRQLQLENAVYLADRISLSTFKI